MINERVFAELFAESERLKKSVGLGTQKTRFLFEKAAKDSGEMTGICGLRGTGKTTLLLQIAAKKKDSIYVNAEELVFRQTTLFDFSEHAKAKGFTNLFIDEVHSVPDWPLQLKLAFDRGNCRIWFSGSSSIRVQEQGADLSRRARLHYLPPLSFREYLWFKHDVELPIIGFDELLDIKKRKAATSSLAPYAQKFYDYARFGSLPACLNHSEADALELYRRIVERIMRSDLASVGKIDSGYIETAYKLANTIALSSPNEVNYSSLSKQLRRNAYVVDEVLRCLRMVGIVNAVPPFKSGASAVRKEYKLLLAPPFRYVLATTLGQSFEQVIGGIREDIFVANTYMKNPRYVKTERERKTPDYEIDGFTFELGSHKYKHDTDYYVRDELVTDEKTIPLQLFCMLY